MNGGEAVDMAGQVSPCVEAPVHEVREGDAAPAGPWGRPRSQW